MHLSDDFAQIGALKSLRSILADTSSLIYLDKIDALLEVSRVIQLKTIPEIAQEAGPRVLQPGIRIEIVHNNLLHQTRSLGADEKLASTALGMKIAVLSDDRRILNKVFDGGQAVYTAIEMLILLVARQIIDLAQYELYRDKLQSVAILKTRVVSWADNLAFASLKFQ